jgi:hypothetical protein
MEKKFIPLIFLFIISLIFSGVAFIKLWLDITKINETELTIEYPKDRIQVLMFLSTPLLLMAPFLLSITIFGTYLLTKVWVKDVVINIVHETYKNIVTNKIKYLSSDEKEVLRIIIKYRPEVLQSDLVKESNLSAYKITRILNRFEQNELIKREKHGITNIIHLLFNPEIQSRT